MVEGPQWMLNLMAKHERQIAEHERRFGKLGELQTDKQKRALAKAVESV